MIADIENIIKNKKDLLIIAAVLIVVIVAGFVLWRYLQIKNKVISEQEKQQKEIDLSARQYLFQKQIKELDELKERFSSVATSGLMTVEEQIKKLDSIRKKTNPKPLTDSDIKKQVEDLDNLRQQTITNH